MMLTYSLISPPTDEPVTLAQARRHARLYVEDADEDEYLMSLVAAARELTEKSCGRSWCSQVIRATFDAFPSGSDPIKLHYGPILSIDSITYGDAASEMTAESYTLVGDAVKPVDAWPDSDGPVKVVYHAGAQDPDDVPARAKLAILMLAAQWYDRREAVSDSTSSKVPFAVDALLSVLRPGDYP